MREKTYMKLRFRKGVVSNPQEVSIMVSTMSSLVHVEVKDGCTAYSAFDTGNRDKGRCFFPVTADPEDDSKWVSVDLPISDEILARMFLADMCDAEIKYRTEFDTILPVSFMRRLRRVDDDCNKPATWGTTFCSHSILLWLRRCATRGVLLTNNDTGLLWSIHSRSCHPKRLYDITRAIFGGNDKQDDNNNNQ